MNIVDIENYIMQTFKDVYPLDTWGEKSFFLNPGKKFKRGTYFATIKKKDGDNDKASKLDRDGVFRLNIGINKEEFLSLFYTMPKRPAKGCFIKGGYDFQALDTILPHPIYGWMSWICILNPSVSRFDECKKYLQVAYEKALIVTDKKSKQIINE